MLDRLLESFTGAADDAFVQARLPGLIGRYVLAGKRVRKTRGFAGLVDCLVRHDVAQEAAAKTEDEAQRWLADIVGNGAAHKDVFIYNLRLHLCSIASERPTNN